MVLTLACQLSRRMDTVTCHPLSAQAQIAENSCYNPETTPTHIQYDFILADFNLVVGWSIRQITKFNSPPNFPAIRYPIFKKRAVLLVATVGIVAIFPVISGTITNSWQLI